MPRPDGNARYTTSRQTGPIPPGANYDETTYGYDLMGRRNMVRSPGGTITRTVFDVRNNAVAVYVGTTGH